MKRLLPLIPMLLVALLATAIAQDSAPPPPGPPPGANPDDPFGGDDCPPPPMMFMDPMHGVEALRSRVLRAMALASDDTLRASLEAEAAKLAADSQGLPPEAKQMLDEMGAAGLPPEALDMMRAELSKGSTLLAEAAKMLAKVLDETADNSALRKATVEKLDAFIDAAARKMQADMMREMQELEGEWDMPPGGG